VEKKNIIRLELLALLGLIIILALIHITKPIEFIRERMDTLGYIGVFFIMFLSSATIVIPLPGLAGVIVAGASLNPLLVGIVGGVGSALGELSGYIAGCGGKVVIEKKKIRMYKTTKKWMKRNGFITIFIAAALPNPFFDVAGLAAGALDYPIWEFLLACSAGKILKCVALAYLGYALV